MANQVAVRVVTVKKLFAATLQQGERKGQRVFISPTDTQYVKDLTDRQFAAYVESGSITIGDAHVADGAMPGAGQAYLLPEE